MIKRTFIFLIAVLFSANLLFSNDIPQLAEKQTIAGSKIDFKLISFPNPASVLTLVYSAAVTSANDSLESAWTYIGDAEQVALWLSIDDTLRMDYYIDYRAGTETQITLAVDSIKTTSTVLIGLSKAILLRGYGASGIVNLIPGANYIRYRSYRFAGSGTYASETTAMHKSMVLSH